MIQQLNLICYAPLSLSVYEILAIAGEDAVILPDDISLIRIRREICDDAMNELILYYRIVPSQAPPLNTPTIP